MAIENAAAATNAADKGGEILKARTDEREYRRIVLKNSLEVLLISDPETDKCAASMNVSVGSFSDPQGLEGLAHFLEHMLFYASEKYPEEDSYSKYITEHGGRTNAYTSTEHTNYHFDINTDSFEEALDRFAQFFIKPLMSADATMREIKAVDSENQKNLLSDSWRMHQLKKHLSREDHPYHKFNTGNIDTLHVRPEANGVDTRSELIKFYDKHYSANTMHLVVYGKENLDKIQGLVEEMFLEIRNTNKEIPRFPGQPCTQEHLQVLVKAVPIKQGHNLTVSWPVTPSIHHYEEAPCTYVGHLIGHEGKGSLFHALKILGWATGLYAGEPDWTMEYSFFNVSINLTDAGHEHMQDILGLLFRHINLLQQSGVSQWIFDELSAIFEAEFHYQAKIDPLSYAVNISSNMTIYPTKHWLIGSSLPSKFNPASVQKVIDDLSPDNVRWVMDIPVFTMVGEWKCKEEEWKFEPWEGWFARCVRVRQNMTYTEFVRTLCEVFSLKCTECNPIISYWMPGKMSVMIESKRPPVYIDNQMSLDTFFLIRGGDPSVSLFVSFITTVKALGNTVPRTDGESYRVCGSATTPNPIVAASNVDGNNEAVDEQDDVEDDKTDTDEEEEEDNEDGAGYDDYQGDDGSMGGSTLDPTIDGSEGSGEDYDYNKWNDLIIEEYGIGNVEEDVILTQQTVQHPGEFSRLLAECTYTSHRVRGGDNSVDRTPTVTPRRTCQHGLYQCTYTTECVQDTCYEGNTDTNINGIDDVSGEDVIDRGIGDSPSGTLDDNRLVTAPGGDNISHSGDRTPTVTPRRTCQHGLNQCTYTTECVQDTGCEGNTDTNINGIYEVTIDRGIGASASGTLNDNRLVTAAEAYEVYNDFSTLHGGELEILDNDAAPVFDDLANFRDDETQVELSTTGETLYVGSVFKNRKVIQQTMSYLAIKQCFCYNQRRSCPTRLEMVCVDDTCPWHLTAQVVKNSECFKITSYDTTHTCDIDTRKNYNKHASYKLLGEVVKSRYSSTQGGPRAVDLPQLLLNDLNVRISYSTAWRAKEVAVENVRGDDIKSYRFLPTYLYLLKLANPGTITHLHSTPEADGTQRFKYVFVSLGASIKGLKYMRKVIVVDGTQLVGRYKGCLLIACAQDGNFQIFPIAFGVVDGETDASWVWFFDKLADIVPDSEDLMIVSDRHSSIYKGLSVVYPKAHHGACAVHLERNISTYYGKYGVSGLFFSAAKAYRVRDFEKYFEQLRAKSAACANYLEEIGFEHWTRAHCKGERYNIMSSNNSESMNNVLTRAKSYPIVYMIEFIREVLMRWFAARRQKVARCKSLVTPEVDERFLQDLPASGKFAVKMSGPWSYQVTSKSGEHFHVVLDECTCTCLRYTKLRIPCEHGLAAAIEFGIDPKVVVGWWYGLQTFSDSFQEPILPIADPKDVVIPQDISDLILIPPYCRRPPGRPTTKRIPSRGENRKKRQKRLIPNQCTRCRQAGHNKKTCKNPI